MRPHDCCWPIENGLCYSVTVTVLPHIRTMFRGLHFTFTQLLYWLTIWLDYIYYRLFLLYLTWILSSNLIKLFSDFWKHQCPSLISGNHGSWAGPIPGFTTQCQHSCDAWSCVCASKQLAGTRVMQKSRRASCKEWSLAPPSATTKLATTMPSTILQNKRGWMTWTAQSLQGKKIHDK